MLSKSVVELASSLTLEALVNLRETTGMTVEVNDGKVTAVSFDSNN